MIKIIAMCSFLLFLPSFTFAATTEQNQQAAMQQMTENEDVFGTLQKRVEQDYNNAKNSFDNAVEKSHQDAQKDKESLNSKFDKMKNEFDKNAPKLENKSTNEGIDMFPERSKSSSELNLRSRPAVSSNSTDGEEKKDKPVLKETPSQKVGTVELEEIPSGYAEKSSSKNSLNRGNTITTNPTSSNSSEFSISKESFVKFVIVSLILFIVMAILYFNGKRKEEM